MVATGMFHDFGKGDVDTPAETDAIGTAEAWVLGFGLFLPGIVFFFLDLHLIKVSHATPLPRRCHYHSHGHGIATATLLPRHCHVTATSLPRH